MSERPYSKLGLQEVFRKSEARKIEEARITFGVIDSVVNPDRLLSLDLDAEGEAELKYFTSDDFLKKVSSEGIEPSSNA